MNTTGNDSQPLTALQNQARIDADNLQTLTLCHFIMGGLTALFSCMFIFHIVMGAMMIHNPSAFAPVPTPSVPSPPSIPTTLGFPPMMGYMFLTIGIVAVVVGWTLGGLTAYAGHCLKERKHYIFILITAGCNCAVIMPLGTLLGAFTFVVLLRPTVKALFDSQLSHDADSQR